MNTTLLQSTIISTSLVAALLPALSAADPSPVISKLKLEVVRTLPDPVIGKNAPGAEAIRGGFEGGTTVKVKIGDKTQYHLFSSGMDNLDWSSFHLEHWISDDGTQFQRKDVLLDDYTDKETGLKHLFLSPYPFFSDSDNRWYVIFMEYVVKKSWSGQCGTMWCAPSKRTGIEGIDGPWEFEKRYVIVPKECAPINNVIPVSTSVSMPFQVQNGRWAVMVSTDYFEKRKQRWPVVLNFSDKPKGPFNPPDTAVVPQMLEPTDFTENPLVLKVKGPKSGRDYWVAVFDFIAPEVTAYQPKNVFGFSYSEDGIHWPKEHGQAVNIDNGLAPGQTGWWRGAWAIRTPHLLVDEGDGTYTVFFTGSTTDNHFAGFRAMGKTTVRLIEE
jgi:hypothetical protein